MRAAATVLSLLFMNSTAFAAAGDMAARSDSAFMQDDEALVLPASTGPRPAPLSQSAQVSPAVIDEGVPAPVAPTGAGRRCVPNRPYKASSPLKIVVDQLTQTATVESPDFPVGQKLEFKVATGGGVTTTKHGITTNAKIPEPGSGVEPYCPQTNMFPGVAQNKDPIVTAFESREFEGRRDCTPDEVRGRTTVFPGNTYRSTQFAAQMPNAIRFRGGQFLHRCLDSENPAYNTCARLGAPTSGECVRVPGYIRAPDWMNQAIRNGTMDRSAVAFRDARRTESGTRPAQVEISETLVKQMLKYGAMDLTLSDPPPMRQRGEPASKYPYPTRIHCDATDIAEAKKLQQILKERGEEPEGGWDIAAGISSIWNGIFGTGNSTPPRPREPARPETPAERKERLRKDREHQEWRNRVFQN